MDYYKMTGLENLKKALKNKTSAYNSLRLLAMCWREKLEKDEISFIEAPLCEGCFSSSELQVAVSVMMKAGYTPSECAGMVKEWNSVIANTILKEAVKQDDEDAVFAVADALPGFKLQAILAFKKMGRVDCISSFMFLNEDMRKLALDIMQKEVENGI